MRDLPIGALSERTGVKVPTIRYYEQAGLMPQAARTEANRRTYSTQDVDRLRFIRHARELGFEVDAIRQLLGLADQPDRSCAEADVIARVHLREIESKLARLTALQAEVQRMIDECAHGRVGDCRVIQVLADHGQCVSDAH
ncbi:MerR family transcriptional regulator [Lichenibacterium minor]|uniref:MerR family transcriptional regulator n=1 Tax=Lichenibacterium minor TaxID=2316528 RepID=A0A4Q2U3P2_9HYPH|nr:helix-turn-helix domain-containing protein [Lichenibacterium minor]RYC29376.1 MerR family transcriptional regulator [Lichenibacterium minor]